MHTKDCVAVFLCMFMCVSLGLDAIYQLLSLLVSKNPRAKQLHGLALACASQFSQ